MCQRIGDLCVPGRPGCVLAKNSGFAVPWEQRLEAKRQERDPTGCPVCGKLDVENGEVESPHFNG